MITKVKAVVLPFLFILPIFSLRLLNVELKEILNSQPLLFALIILLIPGFAIMLQQVIESFWGQKSSSK